MEYRVAPVFRLSKGRSVLYETIRSNDYSIIVIKRLLKFSVQYKLSADLLDCYVVIYPCLLFISIMLGMFIYYYVVLSYGDYVFCLYVLIIALPNRSCDDPFLVRRFFTALTSTGVQMLHHRNLGMKSL